MHSENTNFVNDIVSVRRYNKLFWVIGINLYWRLGGCILVDELLVNDLEGKWVVICVIGAWYFEHDGFGPLTTHIPDTL